MTAEKCSRCDGCGRVADGPDGKPWTYWEQLPKRNPLAVVVGLVQPVPCPNCNGTGIASAEDDERETLLARIATLTEQNAELRAEIETLRGERQ